MKFITLSALAVTLASATAGSFQIDEPAGDRWMYPFNTSPGTRGGAPIFGAVGSPSFDDRDGQMWLRFDTTSVAAAGLGVANYDVSTLRLTLTVNQAGFAYDPTADALATYDGTAMDADAGRPVELFGAGYRGGFGPTTFAEDATFSTGAPPGTFNEVRNVFALGDDGTGTLIDVSNNVREAFAAVPFAIGQIAGLAAGSPVALESEMTFDLNVGDPLVLAYVREGLERRGARSRGDVLTVDRAAVGEWCPSFLPEGERQPRSVVWRSPRRAALG